MGKNLQLEHRNTTKISKQIESIMSILLGMSMRLYIMISMCHTLETRVKANRKKILQNTTKISKQYLRIIVNAPWYIINDTLRRVNKKFS